jgi:CBS domain-containing protein
MTVGHICVRNVDLALATETVWQAAERMHQRGVGALVVVNEDKEPVGIITDRDLVQRVMVKRLDADETTVRKVMTPHPMTIYEGGAAETALTIMRDGHFRRLPVVNHEGKLTGLLCLDDIVMRWAREFVLVGAMLQTETPRAVADEAFAETI